MYYYAIRIHKVYNSFFAGALSSDFWHFGWWLGVLVGLHELQVHDETQTYTCMMSEASQANVGTTSTTVTRQLLSSMTCVLPVGCRYVRGGYRISASVGKADTHCRSAPRCRPFLVTILKMRHSLLRL
jgi:hypothetical protein